MRVFLSHSSKQKDFVKEVINQFPAWLSPWLDDNDLLVGEDFATSLEEAILTECNFLVVFISDDATHSEWVRREVAWAKQRQNALSRVFVLPVLLNCEIDRLHEIGLEGKKAIVTTSEQTASDIAEQLVNQISAHCAQLMPSYTSINAERRQRLKTYLLAVYVALLVASAAGGSKVMSFWYPAAGVTVISFAFTFLITDCVNQLYGQKEAQHFIGAGFVSLMLGTLFMKLFAHIPTKELYPSNFKGPAEFYNAYASILSPPFRMFVAGLTAYLIGQLCNIWIFDRIRRRTTFEQTGTKKRDIHPIITIS
jgi:uncharacterized integral membrane protein (TIGR00697 family)